MKMPNSNEISVEQKKIYQGAPLDETILVTGPPGTGKTVIAFLRADVIKEFENKAAVIMFNKVLAKFTSGISAGKYDVINMHQWANKWWSAIGIEDNTQEMPQGNNMVFLPSCPYEEREVVKALMKGRGGSGWHRRYRCWFVWDEIYQDNIELLKPWTKPKRKAPMIEGDDYAHDWDRIATEIIRKSLVDDSILDDVNWSHLLIDEGQDFPVSMYKALDMIMKMVPYTNKPLPVLTVFADENQRLYENNSTIPRIKAALQVGDKNTYLLTQNYRNTKPIAELARCFYIGLDTGIPYLPNKEGRPPVLFNGSTRNDSINEICQYARNFKHQKLGVIASAEKDRNAFYTALENRDDIGGMEVQSYSSSRKLDLYDANKLNFTNDDDVGVLTVLHKQSCKGLEFDTVFIVELQNASNADSDADQFKMDMYVMCSRARENLYLMLSNEGRGEPAILNHLPSEKDLNEKKDEALLEYRNG